MFKYSHKINLFDLLLVSMLLLLTIMFIWPIVITISTSISETSELQYQSVYLLPYGFTFQSYKYIITGSNILQYYGNTMYYALFGNFIMLTCTSLMAYPLTKKELRGRKFISVMLTITMFFGGGLIPFYLLIRMIGMMDSVWVMVLPGAISAYNVFVFKTFFMNIPESLSESAYLDGAGHLTVLMHIILPLSKALLATFSLFCIVGYWNDYLTSVIYLSGEKQTIQAFLRSILIVMEFTRLEDRVKMYETMQYVNPRAVRAAAVVITITPVLCIYPFLQKYFAKGVLVGSIKA